MNEEQDKEYIKEKLEEYLNSKGINTQKPFKCLNPAHEDKHPSMSYDPSRNKVKCFSCGADYDTFDIIGLDYGLSSFMDQLNKAKDIFYIGKQKENKTMQNNGNHKEEYTNTDTHNTDTQQTDTQQTEIKQDLTGYFNEAHLHIGDTEYPAKRGLSKAVIDRFNLGYIENWKPSDKAPGSPRLIIPTGRYSYTARDITPGVEQYRYIKKGSIEIFNKEALQTAQQPVFITEGEIDALSVIEAGGEAVALGSAAYVRKLLDLIKSDRPKQPLIVALDNDNAGEKAAQELIEGLKTLDIKHYRYNPYGEHKDANEALTADKESFILQIKEAKRITEAEREEYLKNNTANYIPAFTNGITESIKTEAIPTGFKKLDEALDGGLYEGLYCIGAISSLGKTTFITQIADQIAQKENDVLIFSLEMARSELMAKSISRHTLQLTLPTGETRKAKTARGITAGKRYQDYSQEEKEIIYKAIREYGAYAKYIYITEGIGEVGVQKIRETVEKHISFTGNKPIVIIDYLQILAAYNERFTDKQNTDKAVLELKRISRDYKIPVIAISSFNRMSYNGGAKMEAFKESGAIEYSSDVLIALQIKGADKDTDTAGEKKKDPREIELVILKNRNAAAGITLTYDYYPKFNYFTEINPY